MSIIILEGVDKVGKSTLASKLCEEFNCELIKTSQPKTNNAAKEYIKKIKSLNKTKNYLFDRFYLGEMVYGKIYREKTLDDKNFKLIEAKLNKLNSVLIYCWQEHNVIAQNFIRCKETFTNIEDIEKIDFLFRDNLYKTKLPLLYWNYKINNFQQIIEQIKRKIKCTI